MSETCLILISFYGNDDTGTVWYAGFQNKKKCMRLKKMLDKYHLHIYCFQGDRAYVEIPLDSITVKTTTDEDIIQAHETFTNFTGIYGELDFDDFYKEIKDICDDD